MLDVLIVKSLFKSQIEDLLSSLGGDANQIFSNKILEYIVEEYNRSLYTKTLLHRNTPVKLLDIFVPTNIVAKSTSLYYKKEEEYELIEFDDFFAKKNYVTIIGDAGSGKSTLVKYLYVTCIDKSFNKIPIKIELRYLNEEDLSIREYVIKKILIESGIAVNERIAIRMLQKGKMIFFFDGYDEIDKKRKSRYTNQLNQFMRDFNNNYYVLTSRPFTGLEYFPLCINYFIRGFDKEQMKEFVKKQLSKTDNEITNKIIQEIEKLYESDFRTFLQNPLLLSMFILTYRHNPIIPKQKYIFYQQVFDALFFEHDSLLKLGFQRRKNSNLDKTSFEKIVMLFSFLSFFDEQFLFDKEYLITNLLKAKSIAKVEEFEIEEFIDDLLISVPIFHRDGNYYSFAHKSLQEFFAAKFVSRLAPQKKTDFFDKIITNYFLNWLDAFVSDKFKGSSIENFCLLLKEYDENEYSRLFILPLINQIRNYLNNNSKNLVQRENLIKRDVYKYLVKFEVLSKLTNQEMYKSMREMENLRESYIQKRNLEDKIMTDKLRADPELKEDKEFRLDFERRKERQIEDHLMKISNIIIRDLDSVSKDIKTILSQQSDDIDEILNQII